MENISGKAYFLRNEYINKLRSVPADETPKWGKMNLQQMIEHMASAIYMASGATKEKIFTPEEQIEAFQKFLKSEKEFRENTVNPTLSETPYPLTHPSVEEAISHVEKALNTFFKAFEDDCDKKVINPIFGKLDYEMSVQLLYKHAWHHLKQFGITE